MLDLAWRSRAQLDRESIAIYLGLERGMPQAALDAIKGIDAALETVRTFPDVGGHFTDDHLEHIISHNWGMDAAIVPGGHDRTAELPGEVIDLVGDRLDLQAIAQAVAASFASSGD